MDNQKYIIRCDRAGVFYGEIAERRGSEADLKNARNIWRWSGASCLNEIAMTGVKDPENCKISVAVPDMTVMGVIEIIPCAPAAVASLDGVPEWKV